MAFTPYSNFKGKRCELLRISIIVFSIFLGKILFSFLSPYFLRILYGDSSKVILNRFDFKFSVVDPGSPALSYFFAHLKIVWPTLFLVAILFFLIFKFSSKSILSIAARVIFVEAGIVSILCLYINFQQFLIIFLPIFSSYIFVSVILKEKNFLDKIHWIFIILCCQIIFIVQLLSLFRSINSFWFLLALSLFFLISVLFCKDFKILLWEDYQQLTIYKRKLLQLVKADKLLSLFLCVFLISVVWRIFLIAYFPPNNSDSMHYHLTRVAHWLQNQSLGHYYTYNPRELYFPIITEVLFLWTMVASKLDFLCAYIPFFCNLLSGTLIFKCLRRYLNISVSSALIVMLVWYCMPLSVIESMSTKNDSVVSYFCMISLVYLLLGITQNIRYLIISAIGLSLAIGTKSTAFYFAIPLVFLVAVHLITRKWSLKRVSLWFIVIIISCLTFAANNYIINYSESGNLFGTDQIIKTHTVINPTWKGFVANFFQYFFQIMANQSGMYFYISVLSEPYNNFLAEIGHKCFQFLHIPYALLGSYRHHLFYFNNWTHKFALYQCSVFWGGIGAILVLLTSYVLFRGSFSFLKTQHRGYSKYIVFSVMFFGYLICISFFAKWQLCASRLMGTMGLVSIPVLGLLFDNNKIFFKRIRILIIVYSIFLLIPATFINPTKSFITYPIDRGGRHRTTYYSQELPAHYRSSSQNNWFNFPRNRDRIGLRHVLRPDNENFVRNFDASIPKNARVGVILDELEWDYPLFGEKLQRTIIPVSIDQIQAKSYDYIVASLKALSGNRQLAKCLTERYVGVKILGKTYISSPYVITLFVSKE